jgi:NAD(P)H-flavin reductase
VFEIREKRMVAPNVHELVVDAPAIAKKAEAGQFVIVMADEYSERVPFTLTDWDAEAGTITLIVLEVGQSSRKVVTKNQGDALAHVVGPLGIPLEIDRYGTVVVAGGCYGIASIFPIVRALKEAGNRVVAIVEGHSHYMHYHQEKMAAAADELITTTSDGSLGERGHAIDALKKRLEAGEQVDRIVAIGCTFMMMLTSRETKPFGVKTLVALNPIMVDGTGMCGACRVGAYCAEEINSLERAGPQRAPTECRRS